MRKLETSLFTPSRKLASPLLTLLLACLVAIICYRGDQIIYTLGISSRHIASFWPATPFLVAVLLLSPRRIWPLLITAGLGALAIADLKHGVTVVAEIWYSLANLADALIVTFGIQFLFKGVPDLRSVDALAKYLAIAVILVPCIAAMVGANGSDPGEYWLQWRMWFFADALGFLTVTPAILSWVQEARGWAKDRRNYLELAALLTWLVAFGYLTFMGTGRRNTPALLYSLVPPLLWAALRLGLKGVSTSTLIVVFFSIWGAAHDRGPFTGQGPLNNALSIQLFLFFATIPFMVLAVLVEEEKQTRQELVDERAELAEAQRLAQLGSWRWELSTDTVTWSEELYRIADRDPKLPALRFNELGHFYTAESWKRLQRALEEALGNGAPAELELEMIRPDGTTRWVRTRREVQRASNGQIIQLHGTVQDITERKLAETALRESEARFHDLFRNAGVGMIIVSPDGRFLAANEIFCGYLGYTEEELCQMKVQQVTQPEDWALFSAKLSEALETGASFKRFEKRCRHKNGRTVYTESSASLIRAPGGEPRYFVGEVLDVTERKQAEAVLTSVNQRVIEAQEQEAARIARDLHDDINQQLTVLMIGMERIKKNAPGSSEEFREQMGELSNQAERISSGVRSISHRLHSSELEYLGLVAAMRGHCKESAKQHKVQINFSHDEILPAVPYETSLCLFRVLQEALHNAVKHSGARSVGVHLHGTADGIGLRVSDSGVGFDPEAVNQSGLGLVSMRERVRLVQGTLCIGARPGGGTRVEAFVPANGKSLAAAN